MIRFENLDVKKSEFETRLSCPCCHMGFISVGDEIEKRLVIPKDRDIFIIPMNYPLATNVIVNLK